MTWPYKLIIILSLIIGILGRFWGAWVNNESNDNHVQVVQRIIAHQSIEHKDSCWECFQPPLFYKAHASFSAISGADSRRELIQQMQLVSALMSLLAVYFIYLTFLSFFGKSKVTKIAVCFALLNPASFAMGIQGTNDMPVILLGTIASWLLSVFLTKGKTSHLIAIGILAILAAYFKGSGLAVFLMFSFWLVVLAIKAKKYWALVIPLIGLILLVTQSQYRHSYSTYGNPFETNLFKPSPPPFFDDGKEFWARPGITSVWNSYGKFRLFNMLKMPYNINTSKGPNIPKHRTSFWSQMYGSFLDSRFLQHPYSWENKHPDRLNMTRVLFVLGLFLIVVFLFGIYVIVRGLRKIQDLMSTEFIYLSLFLGMLFFGLKYAYDYRDFGCIKAIFVLPVLLPMMHIFAKGWRAIKRNQVRRMGRIVIFLILGIFAVDLVVLVSELTMIAYGYTVIV